MKMEQAECCETLAYKIHTPGNYPEESIQHSCTSIPLLWVQTNIGSAVNPKLGVEVTIICSFVWVVTHIKAGSEWP